MNAVTKVVKSDGDVGDRGYGAGIRQPVSKDLKVGDRRDQARGALRESESYDASGLAGCKSLSFAGHERPASLAGDGQLRPTAPRQSLLAASKARPASARSLSEPR